MNGVGWASGPLLALAMVSSASAADKWVAGQVHGSVLVLIGSEWQELRAGDQVSDGVVVRTLQAGNLVLQRGGETLHLDRNTTIRPVASSDAGTIEQYNGQLSISAQGHGGSRIVTPVFAVAPVSGSLVVRVAGKSATLRVNSGAAELSAAGRSQLVTAGETYQSNGNGSGSVTGKGGSPSNDANGAGPAASGKGDNGVGNGGTPGAGGQNGNAGGNGNGAGKGNGNGRSGAN